MDSPKEKEEKDYLLVDAGIYTMLSSGLVWGLGIPIKNVNNIGVMAVVRVRVTVQICYCSYKTHYCEMSLHF
jgi:transcriptional regulatory protein LevR